MQPLELDPPPVALAPARPAVRLCTLTGIDEHTDLDRVWALSKRFPFAEWGVLYLDSQAGAGRYPSKAWIDALCERIDASPARPGFALHVCGPAVKRLLADPVGSDVAKVARRFGRVQLNVISKPNMVEPLVGTIRALAPTSRVIFQVNKANGWLRAALVPYALSTVDALFDSSGGRGVSPAAWAPVPLEFASIPHGYAGGLGPHNLVDELRAIQAAHGAGPVTIDMEGSLRSLEDVFQLDVAEAALRICARGCRPAAAPRTVAVFEAPAR